MDNAASSQQQASTSGGGSSALGAPQLALPSALEDRDQRAGEPEHHQLIHHLVQQQQHHHHQPTTNPQRLRERADFSRRSQSSPSSLTKHKFGLRPTPSPPRLIIDHQTGDIVESYPEKAVYLRTYQPLDSQPGPSTTGNSHSESVEPQAEHPNSNPNRITDYRRLLHKQYATHQEVDNEPSPYLSSQIEDDEPLVEEKSMQTAQKSPKRIPPPHTGKVYFAPPVSNASHLFHQPPPPAHWLPARPPQQQQPPSTSAASAAQLAADQQTSTFKQALNKLNDTKYNPSACTDIAIVPSSARQQSASLQTAFVEQQHHHHHHRHQRTGNQHQQQQRQMAKLNQIKTTHKNSAGRPLITPLIEDFNLHDLCYLLRIILVFLLSSSIIYLLVTPLEAQCAHYRPTYTHISLILASVNLISVLVFTLFWYCNGVTRTLYSNLSSSAFIVSIYSILVALNLTLGILFFFVNTCHLQRIISTPHQLAAVVLDSSGPSSTPDGSNSMLEGLALPPPSATTIYPPPMEQQTRRRRKRNPGSSTQEAPLTRDTLSWAKISNNWPQLTRLTRRSLQYPQGSSRGQSQLLLQPEPPRPPRPLDALAAPPTASTTNLDDYQQHSGDKQLPPLASALQSAAPAMSPIEAFWDYLKDQASQLSTSFHQFLLQYDLKFIGALHVLCAVCLQYMAMKVAVVRSFFCTPIDPYD